jgi:hypothetical protein
MPAQRDRDFATGSARIRVVAQRELGIDRKDFATHRRT